MPRSWGVVVYLKMEVFGIMGKKQLISLFVLLTSFVAFAEQGRKISVDNIPPYLKALQVKAETIIDMIRKLNMKSDVHLRTRGTHSAMICTADGEVLAFAEDVGRHNAVDKVIGSIAIDHREPDKCVLLSTGRQSGEMVQKAARGGIPIVASMTVPLISGVRLAEVSGVTLASVGQGKIKVYTSADRIK